MSKPSNVTRSKSTKIVIAVPNPAVSTTLRVPVGFWASELTYPYYEFIEVGYQVDVVSPEGGKAEMDALSNPCDPSG